MAENLDIWDFLLDSEDMDKDRTLDRNRPSMSDKIENDSSALKHIKTVWSVGYRFQGQNRIKICCAE